MATSTMAAGAWVPKGVVPPSIRVSPVFARVTSRAQAYLTDLVVIAVAIVLGLTLLDQVAIQLREGRDIVWLALAVIVLYEPVMLHAAGGTIGVDADERGPVLHPGVHEVVDVVGVGVSCTIVCWDISRTFCSSGVTTFDVSFFGEPLNKLRSFFNIFTFLK